MTSRSDIVLAYRRHYNDPMGRLFDVAGCPTESRAEGSYVFDQEGKPYLDLCASFGVFSLGYNNRALIDVVRSQLETLAWLPPGTHHDAQAALRSALGRILPRELNQIMLSGSGSEACEYALRTVFLNRRRRHKIVAIRNSYHGKTLGALCLLGQSEFRTPFGTLELAVDFVPYGDLDAMRRAVDTDTSAVFLEPVLGGGYLSTPPEGYLAAVAAMCRQSDTLLVLDEVQTGFGRTGSMFAFEKTAIVPDILIASKAITGGCVPIALTVVHEKLRAIPSSSDGCPDPPWQGSLVACAAAAASIGYLLDHDIPRQVEAKGRHLAERLSTLAGRYPALVLDAPGVGLMRGLCLRSALVEHALWLQLLSRGVIGGLSTNTAVRHPVLRIFPPLTISYQELDQGLMALEDSLYTLSRWPSIVLDGINLGFGLLHRIPEPILRLMCRALRVNLSPTRRMQTAPASPVSTPSR